MDNRDYSRRGDYRDRSRDLGYPLPYRYEPRDPREQNYRLDHQQDIVPFQESYSGNRDGHRGDRYGRQPHGHHGHHGHHRHHHNKGHHDNRHDHAENHHEVAKGAIAGAGIAELVHNHRENKGEDVSHGLGHVARTVGAGVLGAVALRKYSEHQRAKSPH